jgi:hypothetical protein
MGFIGLLMGFIVLLIGFIGLLMGFIGLLMGFISGWWFFATPLKNMSSSVGMIIPNIWKKMFQTTN